jgi:hypothetical protein
MRDKVAAAALDRHVAALLAMTALRFPFSAATQADEGDH